LLLPMSASFIGYLTKISKLKMICVHDLLVWWPQFAFMGFCLARVLLCLDTFLLFFIFGVLQPRIQTFAHRFDNDFENSERSSVWKLVLNPVSVDSQFANRLMVWNIDPLLISTTQWFILAQVSSDSVFPRLRMSKKIRFSISQMDWEEDDREELRIGWSWSYWNWMTWEWTRKYESEIVSKRIRLWNEWFSKLGTENEWHRNSTIFWNHHSAWNMTEKVMGCWLICWVMFLSLPETDCWRSCFPAWSTSDWMIQRFNVLRWLFWILEGADGFWSIHLNAWDEVRECALFLNWDVPTAEFINSKLCCWNNLNGWDRVPN
jgi:hypothetical protein